MSAPIIEPIVTAATAPAEAKPAPKPEPPAYVAPASQADLDRIIADRLSREKAKYADYDDAKAKAAEYDKAQEAAKTEAQKLADRLAAAEAKAQEAEVKALRAEVAQAKGVPAALLTGATQEALEAAADALIAFRGEAPKPAAPSANGQGRVGEPVGAGVKQVTDAELQTMTPEQINTARREGRLNALLGHPTT